MRVERLFKNKSGVRVSIGIAVYLLVQDNYIVKIIYLNFLFPGVYLK